MKELLALFYQELESISRLRRIRSVLRWDQQVNMPPAGAQERAKQMALVSSICHDRFCCPGFVNIVEELTTQIDNLDFPDRVNILETRRILQRELKLSGEFVHQKNELFAKGISAWANSNGDFKSLIPLLGNIVDTLRQEAYLVGFETDPYDTCLEVFEPGITLSQIQPLFTSIVDPLKSLVAAHRGKFLQSKTPAVFPIERQKTFCERILHDLGFSDKSTRLDMSIHPFCICLGYGDYRITTRFDKSTFLSGLYAMLHEAGHALYSAGLPKEYFGTPMGAPVSYGMNEAQARLWENFIGKSASFLCYLRSLAESYFPSENFGIESSSLWAAINKVSPSLIRVNGDEVTYSLHIIIRTKLESDLINGSLQVSDLEEAWNTYYQDYLGLRPSCSKEGVLQDIQWFSGSFGYFPSYLLGNFYAASILRKLSDDLPTLWSDIAKGQFAPITTWLTEHIYSKGMQFSAITLVEAIRGQAFSENPFLEYLISKFGSGDATVPL